MSYTYAIVTDVEEDWTHESVSTATVSRILSEAEARETFDNIDDGDALVHVRPGWEAGKRISVRSLHPVEHAADIGLPEGFTKDTAVCGYETVMGYGHSFPVAGGTAWRGVVVLHDEERDRWCWVRVDDNKNQVTRGSLFGPATSKGVDYVTKWSKTKGAVIANVVRMWRNERGRDDHGNDLPEGAW